MCTSTSTPTRSAWTPSVAALHIQYRCGDLHLPQNVLATNVFPSLLRRNRLHTVPVYDYVLATEPLTDAQLDRIGWRRRQGIGDCANQFHYYRLTMDNRIVWGGYDAVYHFGRKVDDGYEDRAGHLSAAGRALLHHLSCARRCPVHPSLGGRHRHQHPVLRALGTGPRRPGGLCQRVHRARRRCGAVRRRRVPRSPRWRAHGTHRIGDGPSAAVAVSAGAAGQHRYPGDAMVAGSGRPLGRAAQHPAAHAGCVGARVRFLTRNADGASHRSVSSAGIMRKGVTT